MEIACFSGISPEKQSDIKYDILKTFEIQPWKPAT